MQTQNLQLSNIFLKEQHYLPQKNNPNFNFQLQPITHKGKVTDNKPSQIKFQSSQTKFHQKDLNARKQMMQKAQKLRKQLLLQKIAAKNTKYELRQKAHKQNKTLAQIKRQQQSINYNNKQKDVQQKQKPFSVQKMSNKNYRVPLYKVEKIYVQNKNQIGFGSTKGFVRNNQDEIIQKIVYNKSKNNLNKRSQSNKKVKMMRGNHVRLPELNSSKNNQNQQKNNMDQLVSNDEKDNIQIDAYTKEQNQQKQHLINPILKITDVRYFGIQQREEDFQKMGKNLLKTIKRKYWCYNSLENQQIYQNFQNILNQLFM